MSDVQEESLMEFFLEPQNLIFIISLGFGILLVLGAVLGFIGHDADHDVDHDIEGDHDVGHDTEHDHDTDNERGHNPLAVAPAGEGNERSFFSRLFSYIGIGRVPVTIILMIMSMVFGCTGLIVNAALQSLVSVYVYAPVSFAVASLVSFFLTGKIARGLNRVMPMTETHNVRKQDFVGTTGTLLLPADQKFGLARVLDSKGGVYDIAVRTENGELPKGIEILIIDYDQEQDCFTVEANPADDLTTTH